MDLTTAKAVQSLAALAQPSRLEVVRLLVRALPEGLPAGRIAEELELPPNTLSFHLAHLSQAGLVDCERQGRRRVYRANCELVDALVGYLTKSCCAGVTQRRKSA
jgi:DNA-binding transcriptional ArsR family regulator